MLSIARQDPTREFVLQCSDHAALRHAQELASSQSNISALFDPSGGHGVPVDKHVWPDPLDGLPMGYAGGVNPATAQTILETLCAKPFDVPFWIDMESGVRTNDRFDLDKVRRVLELAAPFVAGGEQ
jgi:phosphoribosylanthranilate isomerase